MARSPNTPRIYKIGITGSIGCGKSLVGDLLAKRGVEVLDTDKVVHELLNEDDELLRQLRRRYGPKVFDPRGNIVRKSLAAIVFEDAAEREFVESLIHPKVRERTKKFLFTKMGAPMRAALVPLLFETDSSHLYDEVWTVYCEPEMQVQRLMARDKSSREEALRRVQAQWTQEQKIEASDHVINNSYEMDDTKEQVDRLYQRILNDIRHGIRIKSFHS